MPVVAVNGVRVPAWAEERPEEAAERVYEVCGAVLAGGGGPPRL